MTKPPPERGADLTCYCCERESDVKEKKRLRDLIISRDKTSEIISKKVDEDTCPYCHTKYYTVRKCSQACER